MKGRTGVKLSNSHGRNHKTTGEKGELVSPSPLFFPLFASYHSHLTHIQNNCCNGGVNCEGCNDTVVGDVLPYSSFLILYQELSEEGGGGIVIITNASISQRK